MKVLIIEDEAPAFRRLQKVLEEVDSEIQIVEVLDTVEESAKWLQHQPLPDLIFMDIQLSDGLSFEIFEKVNITVPVIFTTAFDEYMLRAFKVNSIDYILKPIKKEDVERSLQKFYTLKNGFANAGQDLNQLIRNISLDDKKYKRRFLVKQGDRFLSIPCEDIAMFYYHNGLVHVKTHAGKGYPMDYNLDELSKQLDPERFFRTNRQSILSFPAIKAVHKWHKSRLLIETFLPTEDQIVISAEKVSEFKDWLGS